MTTDGKDVMRGFFYLYQTYGIPLCVSFSFAWQHNTIPDWLYELSEMKAHGILSGRAISMVCDGISDSSIPPNVASTIISRLTAK